MLYWWAPKGTPRERLDVIAAALASAMQSPQLQQTLRKTSVEPVLVQGDALQARLRKVETDLSSVDPRQEKGPELVWLTLLAVALCGLAVAWEQAATPRAKVDVDPLQETHWFRIVGSLALGCGFVVLLASGWAPLWLLIAGFVLSCGALLGGTGTVPRAAMLLTLAAILAGSFHYLFLHVFVIDLP